MSTPSKLKEKIKQLKYKFDAPQFPIPEKVNIQNIANQTIQPAKNPPHLSVNPLSGNSLY